jgi:hypothetical protein
MLVASESGVCACGTSIVRCNSERATQCCIVHFCLYGPPLRLCTHPLLGAVVRIAPKEILNPLPCCRHICQLRVLAEVAWQLL